jgi:hypothetical protein
MDLTLLWRFTPDWDTGRLYSGYTQGEPAAAADYL